MKQPVSAPTINPAKHTLEMSAERPSLEDDYWEGGLSFLPYGCTVPSVKAVACPPNTLSVPSATCLAETDYIPYLVEVAFERPTGSFDKDDMADMAKQSLEVGRSGAMTQILINGLATTLNQSLALTTGLVTVTGAAATSVPAAIGLIQERLADYGSEGTLYMSPVLGELGYDVMEDEGDKLFTKVRHDLVVIDDVANAAPNTVIGTQVNSTAGHRWIYAHVGRPDLRMSEIRADVTLVQGTDRWVARATQIVAVTFDPCIRLAAAVNAYTP